MTTAGRLLAGAAAAVLAACSSGAAPDIELGTVTSGEVVETVAAPATIEPADRVTVSAPASGVVVELMVEDGDVVKTGDPLLRLDAPTVLQSVEQAEAAVAAADALAGVQTGIDLSPLISGVRTQFEAVVPDLLFALTTQADALDEPARSAAFDAITEATANYNEAVLALRDAEEQASASARAADASTRAAAAAQRAQAELALEAAKSRADDLLVTSPAAGVVELARGGSGGGPSDLDLGAVGELGDFGAFLGGGGATSTSTGPIAEGVGVSSGQSLITVYDLSGFSANAALDEIDAVLVSEGQRALVLVDAFGDVELQGVVDHVGLEPSVGSGGGVAYPVSVRLIGLTSDLQLRPGLSGSAEIEVNRVEADTIVPSSALRRRGGGEVVYVVRDGTIREIPVTVLAIGSDEAAIEGELAVGDEVVVRGIEEVSDGDPAP